MTYYLIAGEASGDLHASRLMRSLKKIDSKAEFRFIGGDLMQAEGGTCLCHYSQLAYMGFIPVLLHLRTILRWRSRCKDDIARCRPDAVILVDYPGFNLHIARYVHSQPSLPVYYYISPKIWAWKEYRIKNIKRDVDELFSILPFEVDFFEHKHHYPIHYVGNPTASEVDEFRLDYSETFLQFAARHQLANQPIVALLAGSRQQEIKDNLPAMLQVAERFPDYQFVVAGAPSIGAEVYERHLAGSRVRVVHHDTYALLCHATAALVTSGTATLETALFGVPQVVCYETPLPWLIGRLRRIVLKVPYISLVNLIADAPVVDELVADSFSVDNMERSLRRILPGGPDRARMLSQYKEMRQKVGSLIAPDETARIIHQLLS